MNNDKPKTRSVMHTSLDVENSPRLPGGKIILCDGCHFSFEVEPGGLPYCIRCRRMATHLKVALALREPATEPKWPDRIKELQFGLRLIIEKAKYDEYGTFEDVRNRIIVLAEEVLSSDAALALRDVSQGQTKDLREHLTEAIASARDAFRDYDDHGDWPEHWDSAKGIEFLTLFLLNNNWVYEAARQVPASSAEEKGKL